MARVILEDAIEIIKERIKPLTAVNRTLRDAYDAVLAEDACASIDQPPFPRSPFDGYAFKSFDTVGASKGKPAMLKLVDGSYAGAPAKAYLEDGCAVRIMTGGRIPDGADCVIKQEDVYVEKGILYVARQMEKYENYCHQGEDYKAGQMLVKRGTRLDAAAIAVLASSGFVNVQCSPGIKATILSTGDELRRPGSPLPYGCIYDSNEYYLYGRMRDFGITCNCIEPAKDTVEDLLCKIKDILRDTDLLITTGGVSVGEKDLVPNALRMLGADVVFRGIEIKPGMPTMMAVLDGKVILCLSGNPFSAAVSFELLIKHILNSMTGTEIYKTERRTAVLANDFTKVSRSRRFIRGIYRNGEVLVPSAQGNGQLSSMVGCNCLVDIKAGTGSLKKGDRVNIQMF